jgi:hypothetical protein
LLCAHRSSPLSHVEWITRAIGCRRPPHILAGITKY